MATVGCAASPGVKAGWVREARGRDLEQTGEQLWKGTCGELRWQTWAHLKMRRDDQSRIPPSSTGLAHSQGDRLLWALRRSGLPPTKKVMALRPLGGANGGSSQSFYPFQHHYEGVLGGCEPGSGQAQAGDGMISLCPPRPPSWRAWSGVGSWLNNSGVKYT